MTVLQQQPRGGQLEATEEACGTMLARAPRMQEAPARATTQAGARGPLRTSPCSLRSPRLPARAQAGGWRGPHGPARPGRSYLPLQGGGRERRVSLHHGQEQGDPPRGAEGGAHARRDRDAAHEAQRAPAPVLLAAHLPLRGRCEQREHSWARNSREGPRLGLPSPSDTFSREQRSSLTQ